MVISLPSLKSPTDVLAVVPYLLGFTPERSMVVVGLRSRRVVFQARVDLPGPDDVASVAGQLAAIVARQRVGAALIVGYGPDADVTPSVDALRPALAARDIEVLEALRADGGRYWSYVCQRPDCCTPSGTPYDIASTTVAAEATYAGLSPAASRAELAGRLAPVSGVARIAMRDAALRADERLCQLLDDAIIERLAGSAAASDPPAPDPAARASGRAAQASSPATRASSPAGAATRQPAASAGHWARDAVYEAGVEAVDAVNRCIGAIAPPDDDAVAWLAVLLSCVPVRDYAWERIGRDIAGSVPLWSDIVRRVQPELAAPPATLLAYAAWRSGDGATASIALDRALDADPAYALARLLADAIDHGLAPGAWLDLPTPPPRPRIGRRSQRSAAAKRRGRRKLRPVPLPDDP